MSEADIAMHIEISDEEFQASLQRVLDFIRMTRQRRSRPHPQSYKRARIYRRKRSQWRKALLAEIAHISEDAGVYD